VHNCRAIYIYIYIQAYRQWNLNFTVVYISLSSVKCTCISNIFQSDEHFFGKRANAFFVKITYFSYNTLPNAKNISINPSCLRITQNTVPSIHSSELHPLRATFISRYLWICTLLLGCSSYTLSHTFNSVVFTTCLITCRLRSTSDICKGGTNKPIQHKHTKTKRLTRKEW